MDNRPIGFLDSGVGGLTVVRELMRQLPHEDMVLVLLSKFVNTLGNWSTFF